MNRINALFQKKKKDILSIYFTAGHPKLNQTAVIIKELEASGVDLIEVGMPFSDPVADGLVIQQSSAKALENGMTVNLLFEQLESIRKEVSIPLILMGYYNPIMQYGVERFIEKCSNIGIDGVIIPDLPLFEYKLHYKEIFDKHNIKCIFLVGPDTTDERVREIDNSSDSFIYVVSSSATTGIKTGFSDSQISYFARIAAFKLKNPILIGFGISDNSTYSKACEYANGAIIGSAFVKAVSADPNVHTSVTKFISAIKGK
ncbi:MAG: tryptophan synthase subunit alpha [Bacteroidales bacterium]|nr:tryptophan synthase subunit alpha [Bacteroidales bacterium]